jgi:hypothetical protein
MNLNLLKKLIFTTLTLAFVTGLSGVALAAKPGVPGQGGGGSKTSLLGNDISWPQCGKKLPSGQAFGIVGVNGGLANTTNGCMATQLAWAAKSSGAANQAKTQLYVNTANPGGLNTVSWPKNNVDPSGYLTSNPYGTCDGSDTPACAWQYGWNRAQEDVFDRFKPAAAAAKISDDPAAYRWWLDVEIENTWKTGANGQASNVADLEGMVAYFNGLVGAKVGIYSTSYQWGQITGSAVTSGSNLNNLASWLPGAGSESTAKQYCSLPPLTSGGWVELTQFVSKNLDYDHSCV